MPLPWLIRILHTMQAACQSSATIHTIDTSPFLESHCDSSSRASHFRVWRRSVVKPGDWLKSLQLAELYIEAKNGWPGTADRSDRRAACRRPVDRRAACRYEGPASAVVHKPEEKERAARGGADGPEKRGIGNWVWRDGGVRSTVRTPVPQRQPKEVGACGPPLIRPACRCVPAGWGEPVAGEQASDRHFLG